MSILNVKVNDSLDFWMFIIIVLVYEVVVELF